jgi:hypothetical protein
LSRRELDRGKAVEPGFPINRIVWLVAVVFLQTVKSFNHRAIQATQHRDAILHQRVLRHFVRIACGIGAMHPRQAD